MYTWVSMVERVYCTNKVYDLELAVVSTQTARQAKLCRDGAMQFAAEHRRQHATFGGSTCVLHVDGFPFPVADRSHLATPSPSGSRLDSVSPHTSGRAARVKDVPGRSRSGPGRSRSGPGRGRAGSGKLQVASYRFA